MSVPARHQFIHELLGSSWKFFLHLPARCSWLQHSDQSALKLISQHPPVPPSVAQWVSLLNFSHTHKTIQSKLLVVTTVNASYQQRCYVLKAKVALPRSWLQTFGLDLASVCSRRTSSQKEMDQSVCWLQDITQWMIEGSYRSYLARENEKLNYRFDQNDINSPVNHHLLFMHNFIFGLGFGLNLKKLASALTSKPWPASASGPWPQTWDFGLI